MVDPGDLEKHEGGRPRQGGPVLTRNLTRRFCVAGARLDGDQAEQITLHPVLFRDLATEARFAK